MPYLCIWDGMQQTEKLCKYWNFVTKTIFVWYQGPHCSNYATALSPTLEEALGMLGLKAYTLFLVAYQCTWRSTLCQSMPPPCPLLGNLCPMPELGASSPCSPQRKRTAGGRGPFKKVQGRLLVQTLPLPAQLHKHHHHLLWVVERTGEEETKWACASQLWNSKQTLGTLSRVQPLVSYYCNS